jgi:hypothetical protein
MAAGGRFLGCGGGGFSRPPISKPAEPAPPMTRIIPLVLPKGNVGFASDSACDGGRGR